MAGVGLTTDFSGLDRLIDRLRELELDGGDRRRLMTDLVAVIESQTRGRISEDKESPEGEAWQAWSDKYEKTRHSGHSLLENEGDLVDSITHAVYLDGGGFEVGSNLIYFASHQFGDEDRLIPARASLGISGDNAAELEEVMDMFMKGILQ